MSEIKAKEITQEQLIRMIQASKKDGSSLRYGFILGAGASVNSKIPSGSKLAQKWYDEIVEDISDESLKEWKEKIPNFDEEKLDEFYTKIFAKRFEADYQAGYEELQVYMDEAEPSIGYSFLAQLLAETQNKFVITTNFDTMVEDALFGLKKSKPLVLGHELLSKYINPVSPSRPTIIKIHRDFLFDPYNKEEEIEKLDEQWQKSLKPVLMENAMIVIGYGGNDDSLMNYLNEIKDRKPIYWCYRNKSKISTKIKNLLNEKDFIIQIKGFDKFMLTLSDKLEFEPIIDKEEIEKSTIVQNALEYAKKYEKQLEELGKDDLNKEEETAIKKLLPNWWEYDKHAREENNEKEKERIYLDGINAYPSSAQLNNNYAVLLEKQKKIKEAESYYFKAIELNPEESIYYANYGNILVKLDKYKEAEEYITKALNIDSNEISSYEIYSSLLHKLNRYDEAIKCHERIFAIDSNYDKNYIEYSYLLHQTKNYKKAEEYYIKILHKNPKNSNINGNYAQVLLIKGNKIEASSYIENAFINQKEENDLTIELWFYRLAHYPKYHKQAQKEIDRLLKKGIKSIDWDFSKNIEQAKKEEHKDIALLQKYADLITKE